jgi:hypothetical protein
LCCGPELEGDILFLVDAKIYLLAREHQKAFFWIRSMAQSGRNRRTKKKMGKKEDKAKTKEKRRIRKHCNKPIPSHGISNKMQQCIKILFHIYMKLNMFRATHRQSSGA